MPNQDRPSGYTPYPSVKSSQWYPMASEGTELRPGDLCRILTGGLVGWIGSTTASILGCVLSASQSINGIKKVCVADSPEQLYLAQDDGVGTAASSIHRLSQVPTTNTAGNATRNRSTMEIDISGVTKSTSLLRIVDRLISTEDVTSFGSWTKLICKPVKHQLAQGGATEGV